MRWHFGIVTSLIMGLGVSMATHGQFGSYPGPKKNPKLSINTHGVGDDKIATNDRHAFLQDTDLSMQRQHTGDKSQQYTVFPTEQQNGHPTSETAKTETEAKKPKTEKKPKRYVCFSECKYDVVREVCRKFGFKSVSADKDWNLYWSDKLVPLNVVLGMKKYQKINHFPMPGFSEICKKHALARNMTRMLKQFPNDYKIFPRTWRLPTDYGDFQEYFRRNKNKTYILKPVTGSMGRGIWVTNNPTDIKRQDHWICQQYISNPFLIDGFKFDMRIYVLVSSCDPLRIFVFKDGLSRFATKRYREPTEHNMNNVFMHLTNYSLNKESRNFIRDDEIGSKRRISTTNNYMREREYDVDKMWKDIDDLIIKTIISAHSVVKHTYRTCFPRHLRGSACFEILGFDVILDRKLKPYVIEVNFSPMMNTDSKLDGEVKSALIHDTLQLLDFGACDKHDCLEEDRRMVRQRSLGKIDWKQSREKRELARQQYVDSLDKYENAHMGNYRRIYPGPGTEKYDKFFLGSGDVIQESGTVEAREDLTRRQKKELTMIKENYMGGTLKGENNATEVAKLGGPSSGQRKLWLRPTLPTKTFTLDVNVSSVSNTSSASDVEMRDVNYGSLKLIKLAALDKRKRTEERINGTLGSF